MARKKNLRKQSKKVLLLVEGQTEALYFNCLNRTEFRNTALEIKGYNGANKNIYKMIDKHTRQKRTDSYDEIVIMLDLDAYNSSDINKIKNEASKKNCTIISSNKSFEVWLLSHFKVLNKGLLSQDELEYELSNHLKYKYKKGDHKAIETIAKNYKIAIDNAANISEFSFDNNFTDIPKLFKIIGN